MIVKLTAQLFRNNWFSSSVGSRRRTIPYADQHRAVSPAQLWIPNGKTWHELWWSVSWSLQWFDDMLSCRIIPKFYFKKSLERLCPLNTNSWFPGSRSPTLPTRSGAWKGNSDHVNEAVESGHWWSLIMYTAGSASEQNEVNLARKELPAFFSEEKQPPSVAFLWDNTDSSFFHVQLVVMGLLAFSRFKPPFARAPDHFFL